MALPSQNNESRTGVMHQTGAGISSNAKIGIIAVGLLLAAGGIYALTKFMPAKTTATPDEKITAVDPGTAPVTIQRSGIANPNSALIPNTAPKGAGTVLPGANASTTPNTVPTTTPNTAPGSTLTTLSTTPTLPAPTPHASFGFMGAGDAAYAANKLVEARAQYSKVLLSTDATPEQKALVRTKVQSINDTLVFSPTIDPADTLVESYKVQPGDALAKIPRKRELATDYRLIQRINRISNPNNHRVGQTLKLVRGPFHAVVHKADFRVDIYTGSPDNAAGWVYIKSFACGLGDPAQGSSTPVGNYTIKRGSKLINPEWANPRTGERFLANDPQNPIGEYWLGWQGVGEHAATTGFGFHGTIDPASIGQQKSMGCVRLAPDDIAQLYELLVDEVSVVRVLP